MVPGMFDEWERGLLGRKMAHTHVRHAKGWMAPKQKLHAGCDPSEGLVPFGKATREVSWRSNQNTAKTVFRLS